MLKIIKNEMINEKMIESILEYKTSPLKALVKFAENNKILRRFRGKHGSKSLIVLEDGTMFLCPFYPETYISKLPEGEYLESDSKRFFIRSSMIKEISFSPILSQRNDIKEAKSKKMYYNLSRRKKIKCYLFMKSGRIYGINSYKAGGVHNEK